MKRLTRIDNRKIIQIKVNDWLMLPNLMGNRSSWPLAKVIEVKKGSNGVCQAVKLRQDGKEYWRTTNSLMLIPGREKN